MKINHARSGRPPREAVTKDLIAHVEAIVQKDPHATLDEIAVEAGISHGSVHVILKEHLRMAKLCARWIPHSLTPQQKEERVDCSRCLLAKMKRWGANGLKMLVTGDETYVAFYSPESRTQRQQWVRKGESPRQPPVFNQRSCTQFLSTVKASWPGQSHVTSFNDSQCPIL